jgi:very-short-patch-repair endonuclease
MDPIFSPSDDDARARRRAMRVQRNERQHAVASLAAAQRGVASRAQLLNLDFTDDSIEELTVRGWLHKVGPSVFAIGHPGISRRGQAIAALLQVGDDAGVSHESAARHWGMKARSSEGPIHVSIRSRAGLTAPDGVVIHRPRNLKASELVVHKGVRVTTPERTLVDMLPSSSVVELTRMLEQMVTTLGRSPDGLHAWAHGLGPVKGRGKLIKALDWVAGPAVIRSEFESLFRSVCQEAGLPVAVTNHRIGRWEVDAVWIAYWVAVELDSWRWHGGRWQFHQDRRKGLAISRAGFELLRISWWQLKNERAEVVEAIRYALARGQLRVAA